MEFSYHITPPSGQSGGVIAPESCRYPKHIELSLLEAGYTIRLHGKKITKTDLRKEVKGKCQNGMSASSRKAVRNP